MPRGVTRRGVAVLALLVGGEAAAAEGYASFRAAIYARAYEVREMGDLLIWRYLDSLRPGGNDGGWVDPFGSRHADRYAEQTAADTSTSSPSPTTSPTSTRCPRER